MTPKAECELLLNALLPLAEQLLEQNKEFYPVEAVLTADSTVTMTAASDGSQFPDSNTVIELFQRPSEIGPGIGHQGQRDRLEWFGFAG